MAERLRISFDFGGSFSNDTPPLVVIYNPLVLSSPLLSQVERFGLVRGRGKSTLSGRLNGSKEDFMVMIGSYGVGIEVVPAA